MKAMTLLKILLVAIFIGVGALLVASIPEIRRYFRMKSM